jgi:hypothetical protein
MESDEMVGDAKQGMSGGDASRIAEVVRNAFTATGKCEGAVVISDPLIKDVEASKHAELLDRLAQVLGEIERLDKGRTDLLAVALGEHACQPKRRLFSA